MAKGEAFGEELEADGLVADFSAKAVESSAEDLCVIEGESRQIYQGMPCGFGGIGIAFGGVLIGTDEGVVGDADDAPARIALGGAKGVELFEEHIVQVSFLLKFAAGSLVEGFVHVNEAAGQCP